MNSEQEVSNENIQNKQENIVSHVDLASMNTELLSEELKQLKRKNERMAYFYAILSQVFWAIVSIQLKYYVLYFPGVFTLNNCSFYRCVGLYCVSYGVMKYKGIKLKPIKEMKYRFWFLVRTLGFYFMLLLWLLMNVFFRVSTCQCIVNINPIFVIIISI